METPSPNGSNGGRNASGRFAAGNSGGPGNPHASRTAAIRSLLLDSVTDDDLRAIIAKLLEMAKGGDLAAIREVLDRILGKPLTGVAVALAVDSMNVADDGGLSGIDSQVKAPTVREQLMNEPGYLEYLRKRAMEEDNQWCANNPCI